MVKALNEHWDKIFSKSEDEKLGWYEESATQTMELLNLVPEWETSTLFLAGAGTSILCDELAKTDARLVLNDISNKALERTRVRLGANNKQITWLCQNIAEPVLGLNQEIDIWIDRAVLHFLTTESDIEGYFENLRSLLKAGGHAILAEFSEKGARKCAGLNVHRYSLQELTDRLGKSFSLLSHFDYTYITPGGDSRPYLYTLFRKKV